MVSSRFRWEPGDVEILEKSEMAVKISKKGGPGSGHHGHAGLPGVWGGSRPKGTPKAGKAPSGPVEEDGNAHAVLNNGLREVIKESELMIWGDAVVDKWEEVLPDSRRAVKNEIVTYLSEETGIPYDAVDEFIRQWARTSNNDIRSLALQHDATEVLEVELSEWQRKKLTEQLEYHGYRYTRGIVSIEDRHRILPAEQQQALIKAMHGRTQRRLRKMGFEPGETVRLYRGVNVPLEDAGEWNPGDVVRYRGNAIESWSISMGSANTFANPMPGKSTTGIIVEMEVPIESIVSTARTGFGCLAEGEFVIMGSIPGHEARVVARGGRRVRNFPHKSSSTYMQHYTPPKGTPIKFGQGIASPEGIGMWWYDPTMSRSQIRYHHNEEES